MWTDCCSSILCCLDKLWKFTHICLVHLAGQDECNLRARLCSDRYCTGCWSNRYRSSWAKRNCQNLSSVLCKACRYCGRGHMLSVLLQVSAPYSTWRYKRRAGNHVSFVIRSLEVLIDCNLEIFYSHLIHGLIDSSFLTCSFFFVEILFMSFNWLIFFSNFTLKISITDRC